MIRIDIVEASVLSLPAISRLFSRAVTQHFSYFPEDVQRRVISQHSVPKLLLATIDPRRIILVAKQAGRIIGYAIGSVPKAGSAQLYWLYVEPDCRGANIGLSLLSRMLKIQRAKGASEVSIATYDHRRYYERQGFKFVTNTTVDGVQMDILTFKLNQ